MKSCGSHQEPLAHETARGQPAELMSFEVPVCAHCRISLSGVVTARSAEQPDQGVMCVPLLESPEDTRSRSSFPPG